MLLKATCKNIEAETAEDAEGAETVKNAGEFLSAVSALSAVDGFCKRLLRLVFWGIVAGAFVPLHVLAQESQKIVAVLEFRNEGGLSGYEIGTVTDMLRIAAREKLLEREFVVMTRENMVKLLPPGTDLSKCAQAECEVDIGRQIGADFVVAGEVGRFGSALQVKMKLYDTRSGDLLSGQIAEAKDVDGLKDAIKSKASVLFAKLMARAEAAGAEWVPEGVEKKVIVPFGSEPEGAVVLVDGKVVCQKTPCSKGVAEGLHQVSMQLEGYSPRAGRIDVQKGAAVHFKLVRDAGWLTVRADAQDALVRLNGAEKGKAPISRLEIPAGRYEISATAPCHYDDVQKVVLEPGAEKIVDLALKPKIGAIDVVAEDEKGNEVEAEVYVGGKRLGTTPGLFKVSVCSSSVGFVYRGQRTVQDLRVAEKTVVSVVAKLSQRVEAKPKVPEYPPAWAAAPDVSEAKPRVPEVRSKPVDPASLPVSRPTTDEIPKETSDTSASTGGHLFFWSGAALVGAGVVVHRNYEDRGIGAEYALFASGAASMLIGVVFWFAGSGEAPTPGKPSAFIVPAADGRGVTFGAGTEW